MRNIAIDARGIKPKIKAFITDAANLDVEISTGNRIDLTDRDFVSNSLVFNESTSNSGEITVGAAIISGCNFTLWNDTGKFDGYDWKNSVIDITLVINGESVYMGYYYIISHTEKGDTISVEALDTLKIMDIHMLYEVGISWPIDAVSAINQLANYGLKRVHVIGLENESGIMLYDPKQDKMTVRDAISYIAQMLGKYAIIRGTSVNETTLYFGWYDTSKAYDCGVTFSHDLRTEDITVSGLTVITDSGDKTVNLGDDSGYVMEISDNPFIVAENIDDVSNRLNSKILGLTFRPGNFEVDGTPRIEAGDAIKISTRDEKDIITLATNVTYRPSNVKERITADAEAAAGDLNINLKKYIRRAIKDELAKSGGKGGAGGMSPEDLYKYLRPNDWMTMPKTEENEIYILYHLPVNSEVYISIDVTTTAASYSTVTASYGYVANGKFDALHTETLPQRGSSSSGGIIKAEYGMYYLINTEPYAATVTSDGFCQVMLKIKSNNPISNISKLGSAADYDESVVEMRFHAPDLPYGSEFKFLPFKRMKFITQDGESECTINAENCEQLAVCLGFNYQQYIKSLTNVQATNIIYNDYENGRTNYKRAFMDCTNLSYAGFNNINANAVLDLYEMFRNCTHIPVLIDTDIISANEIDARYMFDSCSQLLVGPGIVANTANLNYTFTGCKAMFTVGEINCNTITDADYIFRLCSSVRSVTLGTLGDGNGGKATGASLFRTCSNLKLIKLKINGNFVFDQYCFDGCESLENLEIESENWGGSNLYLGSCSHMTENEVISLFNSLPIASNAYTIVMSYHVYNDMSEDTKNIVINKGYTLKSSTDK